MSYRLRSASLLPWLLSVLCSGAAFAACGGGGESGSSSGPTMGTGASAGSSGNGGDIGVGGGFNTNTLKIDPPAAMITLVDKNTPVTQAFTALNDGIPVSSNVAWTLDTYAEGDISAAGQFTTTGLVGGKVTVTATLGQQKATAVLTVNVDLHEDVLTDPQDPGVSPPNKTALDGPLQPDPGAGQNPPNATKILYPYDKTVMPRGLTAPLLQFSPGNLPPEDAKVTLSSS